VRRFFERYDLLLTPTVPLPAFELGIEGPTEVAGRPVGRLGWTPFTFPFNLTGQPACTVPCGRTAAGLPVGLQIVGRRRQEAAVLRAAAAFEAAAPWADRIPPTVGAA
jgi:aspartyl-tRNA(Asn)/glutamyl-tRNA(Gln) amidotransferase subunit A